MNIAELIEPHVSDRGTQPAVVEGPAAAPRVMTFADLDAAARVVAAKLSAVGVGVGDRVLVLLGMSGRLYATLLATFRLGAVATFVDPGAPRRQLDEACRLAAPRAVVCAHLGRLLVWIRPPLRRVPHCIVVQASYGQHAGASPARRLGAEAPALLTFTSGRPPRPRPPYARTACLRRSTRHWPRRLSYGPAPSACPRCRSSRWRTWHRA